MSTIIKNIRAECAVGRDPKLKGWWRFTINGYTQTAASNRQSCRNGMATHVKYRLRDVRNASALLRRYGFKVLPPSKT